MSPKRSAAFVGAASALAVAFFAAASARSGSGADALDRAPSRFASYGGYRVHYKSVGSGRQAIVFVHGWTCDLTSWRPQFDALATRTRVLALDLPGHGQSDKPELAYTMNLFALAVEDVLREAGIDRAVLVGHSMGAPVVREFYRLYPSRTLALVAADGALKPMLTDPRKIDAFIAPFRGPSFRDAQRKMFDGMLASMPRAAREDIERVALSTPQQVIVSALEGMFDPAIWKDDRILVPLLVVVARSPAWDAGYEAAVRALGPDVEYRVLDSGHFLMLEKPEEFTSILTEFLSKRRLLAP